MADSLREEIRACVREELQSIERSSNIQATNQTLVERTRSLIEASASSASQALAQTRNNSSLNRPVTSQLTSKRPVPGHPLRFSGKKAKPKKNPVTVQVVPKTVYLIDSTIDVNDDGDCGNVSENDYSLTDSMILVKGECDLKSTYTEDDIRSELTDLFKVKLPLISKKDFDFVRRERNSITTPVVKPGHQWDFKHVKHLCGQGKLYVRLNVIKDILADKEEIEGNSDDTAKSESTDEKPEGDVKSIICSSPATRVIILDDQEATTSAGSASFDEKLANLTSIFPEEDTNIVIDTLMRYEDVELAAQSLSDKNTISLQKDYCDESVAEILKRLKKQMINEGSAEKLKVDEDDLAIDFFQYYKSNTFDARVPIKVQIRHQPAIDSGGVLRQAFCTIFGMLARNECIGLRLFTGPVCRLTPVYSSECILTGVFEILGRMISHSLVQNGPGFPYFAPAVYSYISTGNLQEAITKVSIVDIADPDLLEFVEKVRCFIFDNFVYSLLKHVILYIIFLVILKQIFYPILAYCIRAWCKMY